MSEAPHNSPVSSSTIDPRLVEFSYAADCDINAMKAAIELLERDPSVVSLLNQARNANDLNFDFNHDKNQNPDGVVAASNREWASALIAVAQLSREQKLPAEKLKVEDITQRGQCIYDDFKDKELGKAPAVCNKPSPTR